MISDESSIEGDLIDKNDAADYAAKYSTSGESGDMLLLIQRQNAIWRKLEKIYVYARMRRDENNAETKYQAMSDMCGPVIAAVSASMSFFTELLTPEEKCSDLSKYRRS
ncbi:MAG: hypothetical protein ACLRTA_00425 [Clostridia bacterium]